MLEQRGFSAKKGTLIDVTIVNAPIQRNKRDENEIIKKSEVPEEWKEKSAKLAQKEVVFTLLRDFHPKEDHSH